MSELDPLLMRAFSEARAERPRSAKGKAQTLAALGLSNASAHASPSASTQVASRFPSWPWWTMGVALIAASGAGFRALEEPLPAAFVSAPVVTPAAFVGGTNADTAAPVLTVDQLPNAAEPPTAAHDAKVAEVRKAAPLTSHRAARPERSPAPAAAATAQGSELRDEIEVIERASRALSQRRCGLAREHLAAYQARFPNGRLRSEAEVVAIEIAGRSGQSEQARTAARRFVAQFPDTPYALRLAPWLRDSATEAAGPGSVVMCTDAAE